MKAHLITLGATVAILTLIGLCFYSGRFFITVVVLIACAALYGMIYSFISDVMNHGGS